MRMTRKRMKEQIGREERLKVLFCSALRTIISSDQDRKELLAIARSERAGQKSQDKADHVMSWWSSWLIRMKDGLTDWRRVSNFAKKSVTSGYRMKQHFVIDVEESLLENGAIWINGKESGPSSKEYPQEDLKEDLREEDGQ